MSRCRARGSVAVAAVVAVIVVGAGVATAPQALAAGEGLVFSPTATSIEHLGWHGTVTQPFAVVNTGASPVLVPGPTSADPHVTFGPECVHTVVPAGGRCTTTVTVTDDGAATSYRAEVRGAGPARATVTAAVDPAVTVTSSPVFPLTRVGETTSTTTVALINSSDTVVEFGTTADAESSALLFTATGCLGRRLPPGASCPVQVAYRPGDGADDAGQVSIPVVGGAPAIVTARGTARPRSEPDTTVLAFGTVPRGSSADRSVTYRNTSTGPSTFGAATVTGAGPYRVVGDSCSPAPLPAGGTCAVTVRVRPGATTTDLTGTLALAVDGRIGRTLLHTATPPVLQFPVRALDFGAVPVGGESAAQDAVVTNGGPSAVTARTAVPAVAGWRFDDACDGVVLAPGASCRIGVAFAPDRARAVTVTPFATVNGQLLGLQLSGRGVTGAPAEPLLVTPRAVDVGAVEVDATSASRPVTLTNTGPAPVTITGGPAPGGEVRRVADACTGVTLAPGASCVVRYALVPQTAPDPFGRREFTARWNGRAYPMTVFGQVRDRLQVVPGQPQFGPAALGQPVRTTVELRNVGTRTVALTDDALPFDAAAPHRVVRDGCAGRVLAAGAGCTLTLEITPRTLDDRGARITGRWNRQDLDVPLDVSPIPWLTVDTARLAFPRAVAGAPAPARTVTFTNLGRTTRPLGRCTVPAGFEGSDCRDVRLAPGRSVALTYRPSADAVDTAAGSLVVRSADVLTTVGLGAVIVPRLGVATDALQLGPAPVGAVVEGDVWLVDTAATPAAATVRVTGGDAALTIRDDCTGAAVAPGAACAVHLTYRPTAAERRVVVLGLRVDGGPPTSVSVTLVAG